MKVSSVKDQGVRKSDRAVVLAERVLIAKDRFIELYKRKTENLEVLSSFHKEDD